MEIHVILKVHIYCSSPEKVSKSINLIYVSYFLIVAQFVSIRNVTILVVVPVRVFSNGNAKAFYF